LCQNLLYLSGIWAVYFGGLSPFKSKKEAEVRIVEAKGIAEAQRIINQTLTKNYLQHEAIQAYGELAGSPNTTFVIMPTSPQGAGLPLIIGNK